MIPLEYTDGEAVESILDVLGESKWEAVSFAHGYKAMMDGAADEEASRIIYKGGPQSLRKSRKLISDAKKGGYLALLRPREKLGSAENPITKMFPAVITENRFIERLEDLCEESAGFDYSDDRYSDHTLKDFTIIDKSHKLPLNVKNAGTRFEKASDLVGLDPDDCVPIPAYKANAAIEAFPHLLYVVSIDFTLINILENLLAKILDKKEIIVWDILSKNSGTNIRKAEDTFIFSMVRKYWTNIKGAIADNPFRVISARKTIRILQTKPRRTPGIGLRAWGTGANAEVNTHVSIKDDMTEWDVVKERIIEKGVIDILQAVDRKRTEEVYDPEI